MQVGLVFMTPSIWHPMPTAAAAGWGMMTWRALRQRSVVCFIVL